MGFIEIVLIGIGLSMDAFAVSVCKGISMRQVCLKNSLLIALFFGFFQAFMPLIGWLLSSRFENLIAPFDHWIVFGLLSIVGIKMIFEALKKDGNSCPVQRDPSTTINIKELLFLSFATSIDALAVGISFACLRVSILPSIGIIGIITFLLSFFGVSVGARFGERFKNKAEIVGGVILILLGIKILLEHCELF